MRSNTRKKRGPSTRRKPARPEHAEVTLDGQGYVMLRREAFDALCRQAGLVDDASPDVPVEQRLGELNPLDTDRKTLAHRLRSRRMAAGLTQAGLARLAGIYPESLNRIERGKVTPDFATIRKLVVAIERQAHATV